MSHHVVVGMNADQCIRIGSHEVNVHDIFSINVDGHGVIVSVMLKTSLRTIRRDEEPYPPLHLTIG